MMMTHWEVILIYHDIISEDQDNIMANNKTTDMYNRHDNRPEIT